MACARIANQILIVNFLPGNRNRQEYYWRENSNFKICTTKIPSVEHLPSVRQVFLGNFSSISDNTVRTMSFWCPILETWDLSTLQYYSSREGDFYCNPDCFLLHAIWLFFNVFLIKLVIKMLHNMCNILQKWHFSGTYFEVWIFPPIILLAVSFSGKEIYYKKLKSDFWQAISLLRPNQDLSKLNQMNFSYCTTTCIDVILRYFELFYNEKCGQN